MHPFTGLATRGDGAVLMCCRSQPIGWIEKDSLEDLWNGETLRKVRKEILNDTWPEECISCQRLEENGAESLRKRHTNVNNPEARINCYPTALSKLNDDYTMPFEIPTMEIKLNNLCNLKCRMCYPIDSTSWNDWNEIKEFYARDEKNYINIVKPIEDLNLVNKPYLNKFENNPNFWVGFKKLLPHFRRVEFAGGEPLIDPQHYEILDMLAPYGHQIEIKYATNLTILGRGDRSIWDYWPKFKSVAVNISIDGYKESYDYVRSNGNWTELIENLKQIKTVPNISRIVGAVTVQVSNVLVLDKLAEYFLNDLDIVFYTNVVMHPDVLSIQVLPKELKILATERLLKVKQRLTSFNYIKKHPVLLDITINQIDNVINYMNAQDKSNLWNECIEFNRKLDASRKSQKFEDVTPEFKDYV